jgi:hypothetical protein
MKNKIIFLLCIVLFAIGWLCNSAYSDINSKNGSFVESYVILEPSHEDKSIPIEEDRGILDRLFGVDAVEKPSPYDWIKEDQIHVYNNRIIIDIKDAEWASFTDTNSMDPLIDQGTNGIEIVPNSPEDIHVGDIVSYESKYAEGTIIHRVVEIGRDSQGWYARMKGDNVEKADPGRVRFSQIKRVLVGILY